MRDRMALSPDSWARLAGREVCLEPRRRLYGCRVAGATWGRVGGVAERCLETVRAIDGKRNAPRFLLSLSVVAAAAAWFHAIIQTVVPLYKAADCRVTACSRPAKRFTRRMRDAQL